MIEGIVYDKNVEEQTTLLAGDCRINRQVAQRDYDIAYLVNLEILQEDGNWFPIVSYKITKYQSCKIEIVRDGRRKFTDINLPFQQSRQMSENDLKRNWQQYAKGYLIVQPMRSKFQFCRREQLQ
jgi:hypothetical protein